MLKLRVVISFAVATLMALASLDGVAAQLADNEPSYSGSGDAEHTTAPHTEAAEAGDIGHTPTPTTAATTSGSGTDTASAGDGVVPRWGHCEVNPMCAAGSYCKTLSNGISLCYPA
ncbi:hypothetical protein PHYPSEUDO_001840 [Phytophthora pseudosyringae]|uniref:CBM1 domain-containing protein n=1 Tax=Phytophthora pseudosyringae TaxID=221518 RepID=A0A8T1VV55_9STRA|nr:hypothetical protein PHYPSEUDO_001840 [Phytophthora pseudosyringae]